MFLPVVIGGLGSSFLLSWSLSWFALTPWRRSTGQHWTERARVLYPARVSSGLNVLLIPANVLLAQLFAQPALSACWPFLFFLNFLCAMLGTFPFQREIFPGFTFRLWLRQLCVGFALRFGGLLLCIGCAVMMPSEFGWPVAAIAAVVLLFQLWQLSRWRTKWMLKLNLLRPADERLQRIVAAISSRMGVPVAGVWRLPIIQAQAYALPTTHELVFSQRLLEVCDDGEVSAICAHELAHLIEPKAVFLRRVAATFAFFPFLFVKPAVCSGNLFAPLLCVPMLVVALLVRKLSLRMEKRADKMAAENQIEAGVYGSALEKIYRENLIPAVTSSNRQSHPHLYDRLLAAGITPDFPRPKPAKKYKWSTIVLYACFIIAMIVYFTLPDGSYISAFLSSAQP
jgi:Zn-dependent protease with chaperone function